MAPMKAKQNVEFEHSATLIFEFALTNNPNNEKTLNWFIGPLDEDFFLMQLKPLRL